MSQATSNSAAFRIIVLDDNASTRNLAKLTLERHLRCQVELCSDPKSVMDASRSKVPDLYLLDVALSTVSGVDVCKLLKADPETRNIPIVFLAAYKDPAKRVAALKAGGVDYLDKPFYPEELVARVKNHVEMHRLRLEERKQISEQQSLLRVLCHDLVNPIFGAHSLLELKQAQGKVDDHIVRVVLNCCQSALDVINHVREEHKLVAKDKQAEPTPELERKTVTVSEAFAESTETLGGKFDQKEVALVVENKVEATLPINRVVLVHSILNNLLTNALKFSFPRSEVRLSARSIENASGKSCLIEVQDHGIGMPAHILEHVFDDNAKVSRNGTSNEKGTGFGMPLVKRFVEQAGGSVQIESHEQSPERPANDCGTTIRLTLPIRG